MNIRSVSNYIGKILLLDSACMVPSLLISLFDNDSKVSFYGFLYAILIQIVFGFIINMITPKEKILYSKDGFLIVALSWIVLSVFGCLPLWFSGYYPSFIDALFETVSGFTTTGATVATDIEAISKSVLFWRSFTHWLGGMGVLVLVLAISPKKKESGGTPVHILRAESPGPTVSKLAPKLSLTARIMYFMYIGLTIAEILFLVIGKMPLFDAVTNSFATAGTGGFCIKNDSITSYSMYCQGVISVFMLLFGVNFGVYFLLLMKDIKSVIKNTELRVYLFIILISSVLITLFIMNDFSGIFEAFHHSFFQVVSIITTTGFVTKDFNLWPLITHMVLYALMIIGACAGSTGGGMKVSRIVIYFKYIKNEIRKILHPHSVSVMTIDSKLVENNTINRTLGFALSYISILAISLLLVSINGFDFETTFSGTLTCFNNVGPCIGKIGPYDNFSSFSVFSKMVLIFDMIFGRLEIFPLLLIFTPSTWKK